MKDHPRIIYTFLFLLVTMVVALTIAGVEKSLASPIADLVELSEFQKDTFAQLKKQFPKAILDKDFKTLRKISESSAYLNFLNRAYPSPTEKRFKAFEQFIQNALPSTERYFGFFQAQLDVKNIEDISIKELSIVHNIASMFWYAHVRGFYGEDTASSITNPALLNNKDVQDWLTGRGLSQNTLSGFQGIVGLFVELLIFVKHNQRTDAELLHNLILIHGQTDGLLWGLLQEPILLGRVLSSFTDTKVFVKWVNGGFYNVRR